MNAAEAKKCVLAKYLNAHIWRSSFDTRVCTGLLHPAASDIGCGPTQDDAWLSAYDWVQAHWETE